MSSSAAPCSPSGSTPTASIFRFRSRCYAPFMSFGALEIRAGGKPVAAKASGMDGAGWNWARFEGTTAPQLPLIDLEKAWPRGSEVTRAPETFVGGLSHLGRQGIFAMV